MIASDVDSDQLVAWFEAAQAASAAVERFAWREGRPWMVIRFDDDLRVVISAYAHIDVGGVRGFIAGWRLAVEAWNVAMRVLRGCKNGAALSPTEILMEARQAALDFVSSQD